MPRGIVPKVERVCVMCGSIFLSSANRDAQYCSYNCRDKARYRREAAVRKKYKKLYETLTIEAPDMTPEYYFSRAEKIARQQDREVWGHDPSEYAERQKRKTLAMIGGLNEQSM